MTSAYETEQEGFWAGEFGKDYIERNRLTPPSLASRYALWARICQRCNPPLTSILELGANIGINLHALKGVVPAADLTGLEINHDAASVLRNWGEAHVIESSLFAFTPSRTWDLVFTSGVLIHLHPEKLPRAYSLMAGASSRYVCMIEYYNPTPVTISYRNNQDKLFKRDFAGDFLNAFPEFALHDYGFVYHRDPVFPGDDLTWFLFEKK